jgi:transcriptional regulator with XRE-family HTH domain
MSIDLIDLTRLSERLVTVRTAYGESIDLPNLGPAVFAVLLGVSASTYLSYEYGEREPTAAFLVLLRNKTGVSLDWLLDPT